MTTEPSGFRGIDFQMHRTGDWGVDVGRERRPAADFEDAGDAYGDGGDFRDGLDRGGGTNDGRAAAQQGDRQKQSKPRKKRAVHAGNALRRKEKRVETTHHTPDREKL